MITKLTPPNVEQAIPRPELYERLDKARERPVTWVGAPAGSGKSTLVASYAQARGVRCVWYSVDNRDADPAALFYYLGRAADLHTSQGTPPLPVLTTDHPVGTLGFARRFFEALFQRIGPGLVVFDDCQTMPVDDRWYELVREGCAIVPPNVCLVLISRTGPPPILARLFASSSLSVLGWDDLRLSPEETRQLAHARSSQLELEVSDAELEQLDADFGGWAAGIVLALECARLDTRPDRRGLPGASQQLFDYFASEVLSAADPKLRDLLLRSAFLPTMSAEALDRILAPESGSRLLARLKADNFFVTEHGSSPLCYRYHPLFRDFLLARAAEEWSAQDIDRIRRAAAVALAEAGEIDAALELFLSASDQDAAARLIVQAAPALVQQGRTHTVRDSINRLAPERLETDPWLAFWGGIANLGSNVELTVKLCERALQAFSETEQPDAYWLAWRALAQAYHVQGHDVRRLRPLVERALAAHARGAFDTPELEASILRSVALAMAAYAPDSADLVSLAQRALSSPEARDPEELVLATFFHGFRGELSELSEVVDAWERRAARENLGPAIRVTLLLPKVFRALFSGEFRSAQALIHDAQDLIERFGLFALNSGFLNYSAFAHAALGETSDLAVLVDELVDIAGSGSRRDIMSSRFAIGLQASLAGDLSRARRYFSEAASLAERAGISLADCLHRLGLVDILTRSGELAAARRELDHVLERVDNISHILAQSAHLCGAQIALAEGNPRAADDLLAEGLAMGALRGFMPVPVPTRTTVIELARHAAERGMEPAYIGELARKFDFSLLAKERRLSSPSLRAAGRPERASPEFSRTLRGALRHLHETPQLVENQLLDTLLIEQRAGEEACAEERLSALRKLLRESVDELGKTARTEPSYRALLHTYIDPAPTQLLAAEAARMSFGTYRRHLAAGLEEVATSLWIREQSLRVRDG